MNGAGPTNENQIGGIYFSTSTNKLYVNLPFVDKSTYFGFSMPLIARFSVNTSMPVPAEYLGALVLLGVLALAQNSRRLRA